MNMEVLMQYMSYILTGIGVLAFLVSAIVQTIKEMPELKKESTDKCCGTDHITDSDTGISNCVVHLLSDSN